MLSYICVCLHVCLCAWTHNFVCVCTRARGPMQKCISMPPSPYGGQRTTCCRCFFSPSTMWVLGIELRLLGLATSIAPLPAKPSKYGSMHIDFRSDAIQRQSKAMGRAERARIHPPLACSPGGMEEVQACLQPRSGFEVRRNSLYCTTQL